MRFKYVFLLVGCLGLLWGVLGVGAQNDSSKTELINTFWQEGYYYVSVEEFDALIEANPSDAEALAYRGFIRNWRGDEEANARDEDYDAARALDPNSGLVESLKAYQAFVEGDYESAKNSAASSAASVHPIGLMVLGEVAFQEADYNAAETFYTQAITKDQRDYPGFTSILYGNRAEALRKLGRYEEANADANEALSLNAENYKAQLTQAKIGLSRLDETEALTKGISLYWGSNYEEGYSAIDVFDALLQTYPDNAQALAYRAAIHEGWLYEDEVNETIAADYERSLELDPTAGLVEALQAKNALERDDNVTAREKAELAVKAQNPVGLMVMGELFADEKQYETAVDLYTRAIDADTGLYSSFTVRLYSDRAEALWRLSRYDEALADTDQVLALEPDNYDIGLLRAKIDLSQLDEAELLLKGIDLYWGAGYEDEYGPFEIFDALLQSHPDNAVALAYRGAIALDWEYDYPSETKSSEDFERSLALDPDAGLVEGLQAYVASNYSDDELMQTQAEAAIKAGNAIGSLVLAQYSEYYEEDWEAVLAHYTQALSDDDGQSEALTVRFYAGRANALYELERYDEALIDAQKALEIDPENYAALGVQTNVEWARKDVEQAVAEAIEIFWSEDQYETSGIFDAILGANPDHAVALAYRGAIGYATSEEDFARALELGAPAALVEGLRAYRAYNSSDTELAETKANDAAALGSPIGSYVLGLMADENDQYVEASEWFSQAIASDDGGSTAFTASLYSSRGDSLRMLSRYEESLADLNKAIELVPDHLESLRSRVDVYEGLGNYEAALVDAEKALSVDPDDVFVLVTRGSVYTQQKQYDLAQQDLDRVVELDSDYAYAWIMRGLLFEEQGRFDEALSDYSKAVEISPDYRYARTQRSGLYLDLGRYDEAVLDINHILDVNPADYQALALRANLYRVMHHYTEALADYSSVLVVDPDYMYALSGRADTYYYLGRYDEALADVNIVLANDPDDTFALNVRGNIFMELENYEAALTDYNHALEIDPNDEFVLGNRAYLYLNLGDNDRALVDASLALTLLPDDLYLLSVRSTIYRNMERYDEALTDVNRALELRPTDDYALRQRAKIYADMGNMDGALADYNLILSTNPGNIAVVLDRAGLYIDMGRRDEALAEIRSLLELDPENARARDLLTYMINPG